MRHGTVCWQGIDDGIVVEGRQIRIIGLDVAWRRVVVWGHCHLPWPGVVEEREGNAILCSELLPHNDLVDVIELIPILPEIC